MQLEFLPHDLAPGDKKSADRNRPDLQLHLISDASDPLFEKAYQCLWNEFGPQGEMESLEVIKKRFHWKPDTLINGCSLLYHLVMVASGDTPVAVRDHTAIILPERREAVVHLSHAFVAPEYRRTGIAGWLRALPIQTARHALSAQGLDKTTPITLVGEMEKFDPADTATFTRLKAYEKAGYLKIDPAVIHYLQPDFRSPEIIDAGGKTEPLPMTLLIRRVKQENERFISGEAVRNIADALYRMYGAEFRAQDMQSVLNSLDEYPEPTAEVALIPPTA
ncbi:MAG: hypothetical protein ABI615_09965 [Chthoniobacterales bacterium]